MAVTAKAAFVESVLEQLPHFHLNAYRRSFMKERITNKMAVAHIKPAKIKEYKCKQSKYEHAPELPMRAIAYGPSGSGKSVLLQQLILDVFRGCFERVYIWSPAIDIDHVWDPVKKYV